MLIDVKGKMQDNEKKISDPRVPDGRDSYNHDLYERTNIRHFDGKQPLAQAEHAAKLELSSTGQTPLF